jgi:hypothetical protein
VRGDEQRIVEAFCAWLKQDGWTVETEVDFCDVVAERDGRKLYAEAKGRTAAVGLDVDAMFGQILRRMPLAEDRVASFAVVVPEEGARAVKRVPDRVMQMLRIEAFAVDENGVVKPLGPGQEPAAPDD